jgi:hypothetical protein
VEALSVADGSLVRCALADRPVAAESVAVGLYLTVGVADRPAVAVSVPAAGMKVEGAPTDMPELAERVALGRSVI